MTDRIRDNLLKLGIRNVEIFQIVQKFLLKNQNSWIVKLQFDVIINTISSIVFEVIRAMSSQYIFSYEKILSLKNTSQGKIN